VPQAVPLVDRLPRRTQAERSAGTRTRLLEATITCLHDLGYASTSTPEIARRAGVSRGAQLHHFPTKLELVTSAVEHLFLRRREEFLRAFAARNPAADPVDAAIDILWTVVSGPAFVVWLELAVAARTDSELRARVSELSERLTDVVERTFRELFPTPEGQGDVFYETAPRFAFALLDGLALQRVHARDPRAHEPVLAALKALARLVMPRPGPNTA
jgi:AcrR family transcriptional regulator